MKERLGKMIEAYRKEIQTAYSCNQCYFDMRYKNEKNADWKRVYDIAPAFFYLSMKSLQTEAFLTIIRMYEPEGRGADFNLYKFLHFISGNSKKISKTNHAELNELVAKLTTGLVEKQKIANKILYFRDKVIAHNGKEHFLEVQAKNYPESVSYEEVIELLEYAGKIINEISSFVLGYVSHMKYSSGWYDNGHDIDQLMEFCLKHLYE